MKFHEYPLADLRHGVDEELRERVELLERVLVAHSLLLADLQDGAAGRQTEPRALRRASK